MTDPVSIVTGSLGKTSAVPGVRLTSLDTVEVRRGRFAERPRIPLATTLIAGIPGLGKSSLAIHYGARLTRGQLDGDLSGTPCDVVVR